MIGANLPHARSSVVYFCVYPVIQTEANQR